MQIYLPNFEFLPYNYLALLKDRFLKKILSKRTRTRCFSPQNYGLKWFVYSNWKQFQTLYKTAKFEFKVTVHYDLWVKYMQLWLLKTKICNYQSISPLFLKHCGIGHLKNWTAPWSETFTQCTTAFTLQTSWKNKWAIFLLEVKMCFIMLKYWCYSALYNATLHRLTCKMPLLQKWHKKKMPISFLVKFSHCI